MFEKRADRLRILSYLNGRIFVFDYDICRNIFHRVLWHGLRLFIFMIALHSSENIEYIFVSIISTTAIRTIPLINCVIVYLFFRGDKRLCQLTHGRSDSKTSAWRFSAHWVHFPYLMYSKRRFNSLLEDSVEIRPLHVVPAINHDWTYRPIDIDYNLTYFLFDIFGKMQV